jgi:hypothetical protein
VEGGKGTSTRGNLVSLDANRDWSSHARCGWVRRKGWIASMTKDKEKEEKGKRKETKL